MTNETGSSRSGSSSNVTSAVASMVDQPLVALAWTLGHILSFALATVIIKQLSKVMPQSQLILLRSLSVFIIVSGVMWWRGERFIPAQWKLLVLRGILGFAGLTCTYYSISLLPLTIAMILTWSTPIFVILLSYLFLKESIHFSTLVWMALSFFGLYLTLDSPVEATQTSVSIIGVVVGLLGATCSGAAFVAVRAATTTVGINAIVMYFSGISMLLAAPWAALQAQIPDTWQTTLLLGLCILGVISDVCKTRAYKYAPAGLVSAMALLSVAVSGLFGWFLFKEVLSNVQWSGIAILSFSITAMSLQSAIKKRTNK